VLPEPPSAPLGSDSRTVLREKLGLSDAEIGALETSGVI